MLTTIILAIVQGIAEFLPISSSGHLVILGAILGELSESPTLEVILHAGTLGSILVVYWRRILNLLRSDARVIPLLVIGTLPAAVVGLTIKARFEWLMRSPLLAGFLLLVTATLLVLMTRLKSQDRDYRSMRLWQAFVVGCFQAVAILPGISRAGSTIFGAKLLGLKNDDAVTFSFLLAIPAILGATVLTLRDILQERAEGVATTLEVSELAVGAVISFLVGIVALRWLIVWSRQDRLHWFAWWCYPAGAAVIILCLAGVIT